MLSEVADAVGGRLHGNDATVIVVETDSRRVGAGALFVALRGARSDGHDFVNEALARGAAAAIVQGRGSGGTVIEVPDTGRALLDLAADERRRKIGRAHV